MNLSSRWKRDGAIWIDVRWFDACCEYSFLRSTATWVSTQRSTPAKPEYGTKLQTGIASIIIMILVFEIQWQWKCGGGSGSGSVAVAVMVLLMLSKYDRFAQLAQERIVNRECPPKNQAGAVEALGAILGHSIP